MLSVRKISKSFGGPVVKDVSFDVRQGQYFVLLGASGVGKSVVLEIVAGLVQPDAGRVYLDGKDITAEKIQKRKTALVFQNSSLFPHMSVYDNIAYPISGSSGQIQIRQQVTKLAEEFEITHLLKNRASALSAGQAQRVSLARAVASHSLLKLTGVNKPTLLTAESTSCDIEPEYIIHKSTAMALNGPSNRVPVR